MKHRWSYEISGWDFLEINLVDIEARGWEVFALCPIEKSDLVRIVMRKQVSEVKP